MFVVRFANLSLARYLTNPRVIAWLPALKGPLEPRLLTEILLFWASLRDKLDISEIIDIFTCEDIMDIVSFLSICYHSVYHWLLYNKKCFLLSV